MTEENHLHNDTESWDVPRLLRELEIAKNSKRECNMAVVYWRPLNWQFNAFDLTAMVSPIIIQLSVLPQHLLIFIPPSVGSG